MDSPQKTTRASASYEMDRLVRLVEEPDYRVTQIAMSGDQRSPWHVHTYVEDLFYITEGGLRITLHNPPETRDLEVGESFAIPAGRPHSIEVVNRQTVSFLLIQGIGQCDFKVLDELEQSMTGGNGAASV
jgi:quercetin dioxygenase-like cupin family protein